MSIFGKQKKLIRKTNPLHRNEWMTGNSTVKIGRFSYGHEGLEIKQWNEGASLNIGSFCSIAKGVTIMLGGNHRVDWATTFPFGHIFVHELGGEEITGHPRTKGDVSIGNDVWLGSHVTIMSGVTIGCGAVIAANSVVVGDVGNYEIWGGNPAKHLKDRFHEDIIREFIELAWWDFDVEIIKKIAPLLSQAPTKEIISSIRKISVCRAG